MVLALAVVAVALIAAYAFLLDHRTALQISEAEDGRDPLKRWARGAYMLVNGTFDVGRAATNHQRRGAATALARDWQIADRAALDGRLRELSAIPSGNVAWDHVRRIVMLRLAAGAGLISDPESWREIAVSAELLRSHYHSWDQLVADYRTALASWSHHDTERMAMFALYAKQARPLHQVVRFK